MDILLTVRHCWLGEVHKITTYVVGEASPKLLKVTT